MGFLDMFGRKNIAKRTELMKSLCLDFAGEIYNQVLPKAEISEKSIDIIEPMLLGMFIVGLASNIASGNPDKNKEQIDRFYSSMEDFLANEIYLKQNKDSKGLEAWLSTVRYAANLRFNEYPDVFENDFNKMHSGPFILETSKAFSKHLFIEPIGQEKLNTFFMLSSLAIMMLLRKCLDELK
jgi:hypothetical protein